MIRNIAPGPGINITGGSSYSNPYIDMSRASAGMVRYNGVSNNMEIYDGSSWVTMLSSHPMVELTVEVQNIIEWARQKRTEEAEWLKLASDNDTLQDALNTLKKAQEQVKILAALIKT
jgi:3-dehydroquinate dehydratase